ncbi:NmrA-like family protein [Aspergillus ruber CBS 135680]|uniref:NmrA-like family protein n=1 Tax=Aspergillus ruber (strain CBS 135680) TaxID=1388766 RepID=A0A017S0P1_ASPRC|nr:NmrA-like family protein [Aspergillus ruber CBS 135680]EYE90507.1 NmrA-like family protein [Aspergillus ruber CBS 135680]
MTPKIGVFPASGSLAASIINHLLRLVPASELLLIARYPDKLAHLSRDGATIRYADYDEPESLNKVFDGVGVLMLVSYASFEIEHRVEAHKRAIDSAVRSNVQQIFYSSLAFGGDLATTSVAHVMGAHLATEEYLAGLNPGYFFNYTAIREGIYSESFPIYTAWFDPSDPTSSPNNEITIPHDGSGPGVAWAKRDELGEATAKMIISYVKNPEGFPYVNRVVLLSGPREVSLKETVEVLGRVTGKALKIREISVEDYAALPQIGDRHMYHGRDLAVEWASAWEGIRRGETAVTTAVLEKWLEREPEDYETTITKFIKGQ